MSVLTHKSAQVVIGRPKLGRRGLVWLAVVAVIAAATVGLALGVFGGDEGTNATPAAQTLNLAPGVRFDGGPDEGTRGIVGTAPGVRFDGGPDEGSRGLGR